MTKDELKRALASYGRSFLVAALAVYSTGNTSAKDILLAGVAAIVAPALRAINPKDPAFGRVGVAIEKELKKKVKKK